jgi:hypothetical protein
MFQNISKQLPNFGIKAPTEAPTESQASGIDESQQSQQSGIEAIEKQIESLEKQLGPQAKNDAAEGGGIEKMLADMIKAL